MPSKPPPGPQQPPDTRDEEPAARGAEEQTGRRRVLCLHGFRSSAELMRIQMAPLLEGYTGGSNAATGSLAARSDGSAAQGDGSTAQGDDSAAQGGSILADAQGGSVGDVDFIFPDAHRTSTGPPMEGIPPEIATYEWWGRPGAYDDRPSWEGGIDGLEPALARLIDEGPYDGVIGFSQGGGLASLVPSRWTLLFSSILPPAGMQSESGRGRDPAPAASQAARRPSSRRVSLHAFDPSEEHAELCVSMTSRFEAPIVAHHSEGHVVPTGGPVLAQARAFLEARLREDHHQ